ncbi:MAG: DUF4349 domain-containing protein [Deltaproteobacteria bacterium]|nr:DUF4349 domain-containing protein [Deltaproteobacteria bacterium]
MITPRDRAAWGPLLVLLAAVGCGGGYASKSDGAWRPYQPPPPQPGAAWAQRERAESSRPRPRPSPVSKAMRTRAPEPAPAPTSSRPASEPPRRAEFDAERVNGEVRRGNGDDGSAAGGAGKSADRAKTPDAKPADAEDEKDTGARSVVYLGYLRLEVARRVEAMAEVEKLLAERKGFIERMAGNVIVVRVPAGDFEAAMNAFAAIGKVIHRRIQALDVTAQFQDLEGRLVVSQQARERMLQLLARTTQVDERLRLIQEIKRLSAVIEEIESTLSSLRDLVAFQTITIELVPRDANGKGVWRRSPFPWVRALMPGRPGPKSAPGRVQVGKIAGFVAFEDAEPFTARAADSSALSIYAVPNEPAGDAAFWARALAWELQGRGDEALESGQTGAVAWQVWRARDPKPWTWILAVRVVGDEVWVFDAFLPDPAAWERHKSTLLGAARSFEVKP